MDAKFSRCWAVLCGVETVYSFKDLATRLDGRRTAVTIGVFDGVHLGHQVLIRRTVELARQNDCMAVAITFANHPLSVLAPPYCPMSLLTAEAKAELLCEAGIDIVLMLTFSADMAKTPPDVFIRRDLVGQGRVRHLVCGYDFSFGAGGAGTAEILEGYGRELGFSVAREEPVMVDNGSVKSTRIRDLLSIGKVRKAGELLTRPHRVPGKVVPGFQRGRKIGFPTANLQPPEHYQWPGIGVYVCGAGIEPVTGSLGQETVDDQKMWPAMVNVGSNPTFGNEATTMEAHLIGFSGELSGRVVTLHFLDRLRDEMKFSGVDALVEQLKLDKVAALERYQELGWKAISQGTGPGSV